MSKKNNIQKAGFGGSLLAKIFQGFVIKYGANLVIWIGKKVQKIWRKK